jgi:hypothetical protein
MDEAKSQLTAFREEVEHHNQVTKDASRKVDISSIKDVNSVIGTVQRVEGQSRRRGKLNEYITKFAERAGQFQGILDVMVRH